ncbi:MAG: hypothetical protein U0361_14460 [Nitrospiraceae bacterium]
MSSSRQHSSGPDSDEPEVPEPSHAEKARTLVHLQQTGGLSTLSRKHSGWPFGSVMPYGLDDRWAAELSDQQHGDAYADNLLGDPRASLLITPPESQRDPLRGQGDAHGFGDEGAEGARRSGARALLGAACERLLLGGLRRLRLFPDGADRHLLRGRLRVDGLGRTG